MLRFFLLLSLAVLPHSHALACGDAKAEKFDKFFNRFVKEAKFAKSRTQYPLMVTVVEPKSMGITQTSVSRGEDEFTPSIAEMMESNGMGFGGVKLSKDAATVTVYRANPPVYLGYRFVRETGCWYLKEIEDKVE